MRLLPITLELTPGYTGPNNHFVDSGPRYSAFAHRVGTSHFLGTRVPPGDVWKARGTVTASETKCIDLNESRIDVITQSILKHAQTVLQPYKDPTDQPPDPSFTLQFPDEVYSGSNLFGVQKFFDGEFQFDVFFESGSAKQGLNCEAQSAECFHCIHFLA